MMETAKRLVEEAEVILVGDAVLNEVDQWVMGCQRCARNATVPLDYLLDALMEGDSLAEYLIFRPLRCPSCSSEITEKTLVAV